LKYFEILEREAYLVVVSLGGNTRVSGIGESIPRRGRIFLVGDNATFVPTLSLIHIPPPNIVFPRQNFSHAGSPTRTCAVQVS
jgi:hypothetical protein